MAKAATYADVVADWIEQHPQEHAAIQQYGEVRFKLTKEPDESDNDYRDRLVKHIRERIV